MIGTGFRPLLVMAGIAVSGLLAPLDSPDQPTMRQSVAMPTTGGDANPGVDWGASTLRSQDSRPGCMDASEEGGSGNKRSVLECVERSPCRCPANHTAYAHRAAAWARKGDHREAIADYTEALRRVPGQPRQRMVLYHDRGLEHRRCGNHDRALADLERAVELAPDDADVYLLRGRIKESMGDLDVHMVRRAVNALGQMGPRARGAVGPLRAAGSRRSP